MAVLLGSTSVAALKLGAMDVTKAYLGSTLVYNSAPPVSDFTTAAQRILDINASPKTLTRTSAPAASGGVDITIYSGVSTIDATTDSTAGGGKIDKSDVPDGYAGPIQPDVNWIIGGTLNPYYPPEELVQEDGSVGLTFAPGNSKLFLFDGLEFEFLPGGAGANSVGINWSDDNGATWKQAPLFVWDDVDRGFIKFTFPDSRARVVELIGGDQGLQVYGFNFGAGAANVAPLPFIDTTTPKGMLFGDSFMFGQGAHDQGGGVFIGRNAQNGLRGLPRAFGEELGSLWVYNHGLRGGAWTDKGETVPLKHTKMAERLTFFYPQWSEGSRFGQYDYVIMASTVNDAALYQQPNIRADVEAGLLAARAEQPNAIIVLCVGANAPQNNEMETWLDGYKNGFKDAFGDTPAEWIANGAYFHDGSRRDGANWTPAGAEGSSIYFGDGVTYPRVPTDREDYGDSGHPTVAGHAYLAQKYVEGLLIAASAVVNTDAPANTTSPVIAGGPVEGSTFTITSPGEWDNVPESYTYQWYKDAVVISGETGLTYDSSVGDTGAVITAIVTATNGNGSTPATSNAITLTTVPAEAIGWDITNGVGDLTYSGADNEQANNTLGATRYAHGETARHTTGKYYFEIEGLNIGTDLHFAGVCNADAPIAGGTNGTVKSGWLLSTLRYGATNAAMGVNVQSADRVLVAVDLGAKLMWVKGIDGSGTDLLEWNNVSGSDPATGAGGVSIASMTEIDNPAIGIVPQAGIKDNGTGTGAIVHTASFAKLIPTGFSPWVGG